MDDCSACTEMMSAPALAKSATRSSGSTIICGASKKVEAGSLGPAAARPGPGRPRQLAREARTRWQSSTLSVTGRSAATTSGPMVMFGTNRPSITSMWIHSAPATSTAFTCRQEGRRRQEQEQRRAPD